MEDVLFSGCGHHLSPDNVRSSSNCAGGSREPAVDVSVYAGMTNFPDSRKEAVAVDSPLT